MLLFLILVSASISLFKDKESVITEPKYTRCFAIDICSFPITIGSISFDV